MVKMANGPRAGGLLSRNEQVSSAQELRGGAKMAALEEQHRRQQATVLQSDSTFYGLFAPKKGKTLVSVQCVVGTCSVQLVPGKSGQRLKPSTKPLLSMPYSTIATVSGYWKL